MEFSRLVKAVLHRDVAPAVSPDPRLVEDLASRMGNLTVLHKGCPDLISNGKVDRSCTYKILLNGNGTATALPSFCNVT